MYNPSCRKCPLWQTVGNVCLPGRWIAPQSEGGKTALVCGQAPGREEDSTGRVFTGDTGDVLSNLLSSTDLGSLGVFATNIVKCMSSGDALTPEFGQSCLEYFTREVDEIQPDVILLMGRYPIQTLLGGKLRVEEARAQVHQFRDIPLLCTYNPAAWLYAGGHLPEMLMDFQRTYDLAAGNTPLREELDIRFGPPPLSLSSGGVCFDFETTGVNIRTDRIITCSVTPVAEPSISYVVRWDDAKSRAQVQQVLEKAPYLVGHNLKFDLGITHCDSLQRKLVYDTLIGVALYYPDAPSKGLKIVGPLFTGIQYPETLADIQFPHSDPSAATLRDWSRLMYYNGLDTIITTQLFHFLVSRSGPWPLLKWMHEMLPLSIQMEMSGVAVDTDLARSRRDALLLRMESAESDLQQLVDQKYGVHTEVCGCCKGTGKSLRAGFILHPETKEPVRAKSLKPTRAAAGPWKKCPNCRGAKEFTDRLSLKFRESAPFKRSHSVEAVKKYVFNILGMPVDKYTPSGQPSFDKEVKNDLKKVDKTGFIDLYQKWNYHQYLISNYLTCIIDTNQDGLIYPRAMITKTEEGGTITGRITVVDPPLQIFTDGRDYGGGIYNMHELIRSRYEGGQILKSDLSQIELRVVAVESKDSNLLDAFRSGRDLHTHTAHLMYGKAPEDISPGERAVAKTVNFLILYGGGPDKLVSTLLRDRGEVITLATAKDLIASWYKAYPDVLLWKTSLLERAHSTGYVTSPTGRVMFVPDLSTGVPKLVQKAERTAVNFPIQGGASDVAMMAMMLLSEEIRREKSQSIPLFSVYDAVLVDVPSESEGAYWGDCFQRLLDSSVPSRMMDLFNWDLCVPIKTETTIKERWT